MTISRFPLVVFVIILFITGSSAESQSSQSNNADTVWFTGISDSSVSGIYRLNVETGDAELVERDPVVVLPLRFSNDSNWVVYGNTGGINLRSLQSNEWQNPYPVPLNSSNSNNEWQVFYPAPLNPSVPTRLELAWLPDDRYFLYTFLDDPSISGVPYGNAGSTERTVDFIWRERDCSQITWHLVTQRFALICTDEDQSNTVAVFWNQDPVPYQAGEFTLVIDNVDLTSHTYQWEVQNGVETLIYTQIQDEMMTVYVMRNDGTSRSVSLQGRIPFLKFSDDQFTLAMIQRTLLLPATEQDCIVTMDLRQSNLFESIVQHACIPVTETQNGETGFSAFAWYSDNQHLAVINRTLNQGMGIERIDLATNESETLVTGFVSILDIAVAR